MKITKEQLERLVKIATLNILRELQSRAQDSGIEEGKRQRQRERGNKEVEDRMHNAAKGELAKKHGVTEKPGRSMEDDPMYRNN
jgi:cell division protein ZapA (FtsZ GTPase activity inhibitor)